VDEAVLLKTNVMKNKIVDYDIVEADSVEKLVELVRKKIEEGFEATAEIFTVKKQVSLTEHQFLFSTSVIRRNHPGQSKK